jgi:hypothetical protein
MSSRIERSLLAIASLSSSFVLSAAAGTAAAECSVARPRPDHVEERPASQLADPGWVDVGAGIVVARHAGPGRETGVGNMVALRAYPFGRWYAALKSTTPDAATNAAMSDAVQAQKDAQKNAQDKQEAATAKVAAAGKAQDKAKATAKNKDASDDQKKADSDDAKKLTDDAQKAQDLADDARQKADIAAKTVYSQMQAVADQFSNIYSVCERNGYTALHNRVSFFIGRSVGGFDDKVVQGDINVFGVAFDIAPQFSITWGKAYFKQAAETAGGPNPSKSSNVVGVQLNLNAFKIFRNLTGSP